MSINLAMYKYKETYLNHPGGQGTGFLIQGLVFKTTGWVSHSWGGGGGAPAPPILQFFLNPPHQNQCPQWGTPPPT